jgi:glycosyltransferase involved in cell wall biosynthesis
MLTIQILTKNNASTVAKTLESIDNLGARILVGDFESSDDTHEICSDLGAEVVPLELRGDFSRARNSLLGDGLNMYIEPWEVLVRGHERIPKLESSSMFYVIQNNIVSKEIRFWGGSSFVNPAYETIVDPNAACVPEIVILSSGSPGGADEKMGICRRWMDRRPTEPEPYYYMACSSLSNRKYEEFFSFASKYLAMEPSPGVSGTMLCYYMAQVQFRLGMWRDAERNALYCLSMHPTFAEFWCLWGDMLYKQAKYDRAKSMYENAMIIGKRRIGTDSYPIEIAKYGDHPRRIIENIESMRRGSLEKNV